jgi:formate hydrogenlyase subunit 6/NADH:ubiquinone oxidoreductase subunit I
LQQKDLSFTSLNNKLEKEEVEVAMMKTQIEKLNKTIKDLNQQHKLTSHFNEEKLVKKTMQLEAVLKEKKCKNCVICLEGMN